MRIIISIVMLVMLITILLAEDLSYLNKELILSELNTVVRHSFFLRGYGNPVDYLDFKINKIVGLKRISNNVVKIIIDDKSLAKYLEIRKKDGRTLFESNSEFRFRYENVDIENISNEDLPNLTFYFGKEQFDHPQDRRSSVKVENDVALALHATLKEIERQESRFFSFRKEIHFGNLLFEDRGDYLIVSSESTGKKNDNWRCHVRKFSNEVIKFYFPHKKPQVSGEITKVEQEIVMIIHATFTEYEKHFNILEGYSKGKRVLFGVHIGDLIIEERNDHFRIFPKGIEGIIGGGFNCCIQKGTYEVIKFVRGK